MVTREQDGKVRMMNTENVGSLPSGPGERIVVPVPLGSPGLSGMASVNDQKKHRGPGVLSKQELSFIEAYTYIFSYGFCVSNKPQFTQDITFHRGSEVPFSCVSHPLTHKPLG